MKRGEKKKGKAPWLKKKFTVINEKLIHESVRKIRESKEESDDKKHPGKRITEEKIDYHSITKLVFSFKNLYKISNLEGFTNLQILLLDNNSISTISHITHLTELRRLDLSFNKITEIPEGCFRGLSKLENLSLFANEIEELKNLDDLTNLKCLNVGRNGIRSSNIRYLRKFKNLRSLVLCNNPIFQDRNYKNIVLEYLSKLTFLDHRLVLLKDIEEARGRSDNIQKLELEEEQEKKKMFDQEEIDKSREELIKANLEGLYGLYDQIFENIPPELKHFDIFTSKIQEEHYKIPFLEAVHKFKDNMFIKLKEKEDEIKELNVVLEEEKSKTISTSRRKIKEFERLKKKIFSKLSASSSNSLLSKSEGLKLLKDLESKAQILGDELIESEVSQSEAFNEIVAEFVENFRQLNNTEVIEMFFEVFREIDNKFSAHYDSKIIQLAKEKEEIERKAKDIDLEQLETIKMYLDDIESLKNFLEGSKKERAKVLAKKEDYYINVEKQRNDEIIGSVQTKEHERNRMRIFEIWSYLNRVSGTGEQLKIPSEITMAKENFLMSKNKMD